MDDGPFKTWWNEGQTVTLTCDETRNGAGESGADSLNYLGTLKTP
jgi:hypothetical protein